MVFVKRYKNLITILHMTIKKASLAMHIEQFNIDNLYFSQPVKNNIINQGYFYRLQYSNDIITINCLQFILPMSNTTLVKYFNKYKCIFNDNNNDIVKKLQELEIKILSKINTTKKPKFNLYDQIKNNGIKFFSSSEYPEKPNNFNILFKISGIWEDADNYGITYKCSDY